jgi:hypothetical protein
VVLLTFGHRFPLVRLGQFYHIYFATSSQDILNNLLIPWMSSAAMELQQFGEVSQLEPLRQLTQEIQ